MSKKETIRETIEWLDPEETFRDALGRRSLRAQYLVKYQNNVFIANVHLDYQGNWYMTEAGVLSYTTLRPEGLVAIAEVPLGPEEAEPVEQAERE